MDILYTIGPYLASGLSALLGWFFGRRKQKNDFLTELQHSIDMLVAKNKELYEEVVELRAENVELKTNQKEMIDIISNLQEAILKSDMQKAQETIENIKIPPPKRRRSKQTAE